MIETELLFIIRNGLECCLCPIRPYIAYGDLKDLPI